MDPPLMPDAGGTSNGHHVASPDPVGPVDPPEECEAVQTRPHWHSAYPLPPKRAFQQNGYHGDDQLDEFEMEGLMMTQSRRSSFSSVGAGSSVGAERGNSITQQLVHRCAPLMAVCSLAWDPRNRSKSAIGLMFFAFLCLIALTKNDANVSHNSLFGSSKGKDGRRKKNDPLAKLTESQRLSLLKEVYGTWTFYDGGAEDRPKVPYMTVENAGNPYLDLPEDKFPEESWQSDAVYANHFLDAAEKLVRRAQQAIFDAYHGHGLTDVHVVENGDEESVEFAKENADQRVSERLKMFHLQEVDLGAVTTAEDLQAAAPDWQRTGGWTTERSFNGLERRLIHAVNTRTKFTVVITGSWQSMGYGGNHASQSMAGVFESLLKGLFEKLEVDLVVRAIGLPPLEDLSPEEEAELLDGGKSTLLHTLGWSSIYGSDVDMVVWDDYSAVDDDGAAHDLDELSKQLFDLFARQALLSGEASLPFIWGGDFEVLRYLHEHADADVGQLGNGLAGVPETKNARAVTDLPWAAAYLNCPKGMQSTCQRYQFESICWIDRSDVTPPTEQLDSIPVMPTAIGWRMQQLKGYTLAYNFLHATIEALERYSEITISQGFPLADEYWFIGDYIKNVQEKVKSLDESVAPHCFQLQERIGLPKRMCTHRMNGRTEYTPRANPTQTSVRSLLDPAQFPKELPKPLYNGEDVENPITKIAQGEVDALEIIGLSGKRRRRYLGAANATISGKIDSDDIARQHRLLDYGDGCDGSLFSSASCGRLPSSSCLLEGHQGSRGGIWGSETTGWLVLNKITTENGYIALNLEIGSGERLEVGGDERRRRRLLEIPDSFVLEYAIDGAITTLDKTQLLDKLQRPVPGAGLLVVMDDAAITGAKDVTVAVRSKGCTDEADCQYGVTHVYWS
ncbi:hypothetical protein ACHAXT_007291 [Thalassiosira profunda]